MKTPPLSVSPPDPSGVAEPVADADAVTPAPCAGCGKPAELCVCAAITPLDHRLFVLILQHPQEKSEVLGTALLAARQFRRSLLRVGLSWPSLKRVLEREVDPRRWGVLYLGAAHGTRSGLVPGSVMAVDKSGVPLADSAAVLSGLDGIILLDGTWSQAKTLWWRNAWLLKCRRLVITPDVRSRYGALRREPRREALSTLEAAAFCLSRLGNDLSFYETAIQPFAVLVDKLHQQRKRH